MGALSITSTSVNQSEAAVVIECVDNTGLYDTPYVLAWCFPICRGFAVAAGLVFAPVSVGVVPDAAALSSTGASFDIKQQVGYLQNGRSIACR